MSVSVLKSSKETNWRQNPNFANICTAMQDNTCRHFPMRKNGPVENQKQTLLIGVKIGLVLISDSFVGLYTANSVG